MILKVSEGVGVGLLGLVRRRLGGEKGSGGSSRFSPLRFVKRWVFRKAFGTLRDVVDYASHGGAPLLGVHGVCVIAHGRSDGGALANALEVARKILERDVNGHIVDSILTGAEVESPGAEVG